MANFLKAMNKITDYSKFLSVRSARRKPSPIRELQPLVKLPGMISLGGGMPNSSLFPIAKLTVTLKGDSQVEISSDLLDKALQYSPSYGIPELVDWLKNHQLEEHKLQDKIPPWDICITTGSQDAMAKTFDMLVDDGDYVITENPTYSGAIAALHPTGAKLVGIETDQDGMNPEHLESVLSSWNFSEKRLRIVYTIPIGQNPSGATLTIDRKKKIYEIASRYNLLIVEDDPYYFLQLPTPSKPIVETIPSFLSMDVEGRVIRFDSFSKIMSSGIRLGWITGPKYLVERVQLDQQASVLHASGISQVLLYSILTKWGKEGFNAQKKAVELEYTKRRDFTVQCAEKYLKGLAEWYLPAAGMFIWFKLKGIEDTSELIMKKAVEEKFLMVPGKAFTPDATKPSPYVRAAFSTATFEQIEEAIKRLANLLKNYNK